MKKNISKTIDILLIIGASTLIGINSFTLIKNKEIVKALNFENYKIENENITLDEKQESLNLSNQVDFLNKELKFFNCNIFFNEKGFYIKDSLLKIKGISPIYLYLRDEHFISYDTTKESLIIDENYNVFNIKNTDTIQKGINTFTQKDTNKEVIIAQKPFKDNLISISYFLENKENEKEQYSYINSLLNNSCLGDINIDIDYFLNDLKINKEWTKNIIITKDFITLTKDEQTIYLSKYNGNVEKDGFNEELTINNKKFKYGKYINKETNNTIYIIDNEFPIQILIPSDIDIKNIFT